MQASSAGLPSGASSSVADLAPVPRMGGFELSFFLPFDRHELFDELVCHPRTRHPLGASPNVAFTILRPGYDPSNEVCEERADGPLPLSAAAARTRTHTTTRIETEHARPRP